MIHPPDQLRRSKSECHVGIFGYAAIGVCVGGVVGFFGTGVAMDMVRPGDRLGNAISMLVGGFLGLLLGVYVGTAYGYYRVMTAPPPSEPPTDRRKTDH
jgi:hypothetical protein